MQFYSATSTIYWVVVRVLFAKSSFGPPTHVAFASNRCDVAAHCKLYRFLLLCSICLFLCIAKLEQQLLLIVGGGGENSSFWKRLLKNAQLLEARLFSPIWGTTQNLQCRSRKGLSKYSPGWPLHIYDWTFFACLTLPECKYMIPEPPKKKWQSPKRSIAFWD